MCEVVKVKIDFYFIAACAWTGASIGVTDLGLRMELALWPEAVSLVWQMVSFIGWLRRYFWNAHSQHSLVPQSTACFMN